MCSRQANGKPKADSGLGFGATESAENQARCSITRWGCSERPPNLKLLNQKLAREGAPKTPAAAPEGHLPQHRLERLRESGGDLEGAGWDGLNLHGSPSGESHQVSLCVIASRGGCKPESIVHLISWSQTCPVRDMPPD